MKFTYFLCTILIFHSLDLSANFRTIAEKGRQAADFEEGFYYTGLGSPVIGNGGHVAFSGSVFNAQGEGFKAIWSGKPGELKNILKKGDIVKEFSVAPIFMSSSKWIVSNSGSIAFEAGMLSSTDFLFDKFDGSYLATVNGKTVGVIQEGSKAVGFEKEVTVQRLDKFLFADAGMAIQGKTSSLVEAIWFWNNDEIELIVFRGDNNKNFFPGCFAIRPKLVDMNQNGEVLFRTDFMPNSEIDCPFTGLFTWKEGIFRVAVSNDAGTHNNELGASINNNGAVLYSSQYIAPQISRWGTFLTFENGETEYIMLNQDEAPAELGWQQRLISPHQISASNVLGRTVGLAISNGGQVILSGDSRPINQVTNSPNETHLTALAYNGMQAPGLEPGWLFNGHNFVRPLINDQGDVVFSNTISHSSNDRIFGIWKSDFSGELNMLISDGMPILLDGENKMIDNINDLVTDSRIAGQRTAVSTNSAVPSSFNDLNQLVLSGRLAERGEGEQVIIFYEEDDCIAKYSNEGTLTIPCVAVTDSTGSHTIYHATMQLLPASTDLSFELNSAEMVNGIPISNSCIATFNQEGLLTLPCVRVPDALDTDSQMYKANLGVIPSSSITFKLIDAQLHN